MFVVRKCFDLIMLISKRVSFSLGMFYPLKHPFEFVSWELQRVWFPLLCTHLAIPMNIFHCITFHNWSIAWWRYGRLLNMVARKIIKFCLYFWTLCLIHKRELSLKSFMLASLSSWSAHVDYSSMMKFPTFSEPWKVEYLCIPIECLLYSKARAL